LKLELWKKRKEPELSKHFALGLRKICEHIFKLASWSVLAAAVKYAADKSGDWKLTVCFYILEAALFGYIQTLVENFDIELYEPTELRSRRKLWFEGGLSVVIGCAIFIGLIYFSIAIVTAFTQEKL
jgi:hypothetical protein